MDPGKTMKLQDLQIINGLQITKIIYHHFQGGAATPKDRNLLVQIIVTSDAQARDQIIRATSYQSQSVTIDDLQAMYNAKIQRIEP